MDLVNYSKDDSVSSYCMHLFGCPYQFTDSVDPRVDDVSKDIGINFLQNFMLEAPIATIIPGKPSFLPGASKDEKISTAESFVEASGNEAFKNLLECVGTGSKTDDQYRLYDFKPDYNEYINYVNVLCRTAASFLNLTEKINVDGTEYSFQNFDWRNYKLNKYAPKTITEKVSYVVSSPATKNDNKKDKKSKNNKKKNKKNNKKTGKVTDAMKGDSRYNNVETETPETSVDSFKTQKFNPSSSEYIFGQTEEESDFLNTIEELKTNYNYLQFYVDPDTDAGESYGNQAGASAMSDIFSGVSSSAKDIAFMVNSTGIDASSIQDFVSGATGAVGGFVSGLVSGNSGIGSVVSRIVNLGGDVLKGNNVVIPEIYQSSSVSRNINLTVHLKTPYGNVLGFYMDVLVPLLHILALVWPRQSTSNTYASPFLVKCYIEGVLSCNLGLVESVSISRVADSYSANGLPNEIDVTMSIVDLYSAISMSSAKSPVLFLENSSLIEYLATNCGLNLVKPNSSYKFSSALNTVINKFNDIPSNINAEIGAGFTNFLGNIMFGYLN